MTQDEIIEITKRSGLGMLLEIGGMDKCLEHFAKLVAAKATASEREACAKVCANDVAQAMDFTGGTFVGGYFANKILARGEQA